MALTLLEDDVAEELEVVLRGTVPPAVFELRLALVYGHERPDPHTVHQLHIPAADPALTLHQARQILAVALVANVGQAGHLRKSPGGSGVEGRQHDLSK